MGQSRVNGTDIEIKQEGKVVVIPVGVPLEDIYVAIGREIESQNEDVRINATISAFSYKDAALQFHKALAHPERGFGFVSAKQNMFGGTDNSSLQVEVAPGEFVAVPWGRFEVPGVRGFLQTGVTVDAFGHTVLQISGVVKRKHEAKVLEAISFATELVQTESIYRGRALEIRLKDDYGNALAEPDIKFVKVDPTLRERIVFDKVTNDAVETYIYTPIELRHLLATRNIGRKKGALLFGPYGTGKTLVTDAAGGLAVKHGMTYLKVARADDLADVMKAATRFLGASLITCEDVDQVLAGERNVSMNDILNTIDTTDKDVELLVLLTTNHVEQIAEPMLRAGRLDAKIYVGPPDADAAERLLRLYGDDQIEKGEDISAAAALMAGNNAGDIREVIERAKLAELRRNRTETAEKINSDDLLLIAETMQPELVLSKPRVPDTRSEQVKAAQLMADAIAAQPSTADVVAAVAATLTSQPKRR